jgi:hypothetical protein
VSTETVEDVDAVMDTDSDRFLRLPTFLIDRPIKKEWSRVKKVKKRALSLLRWAEFLHVKNCKETYPFVSLER